MSQVKLKSERLIITCKTMWETYNGFWLGATILKAMKHSSPKKKSKKRKQLEHCDLKYHLLGITREKAVELSQMQIKLKIKINLKIVERAVRVLLGEFHLGLISFSSNIMSSFPAKITHNQRRKSLSSEITLNEQNWKNRKCCFQCHSLIFNHLNQCF